MQQFSGWLKADVSSIDDGLLVREGSALMSTAGFHLKPNALMVHFVSVRKYVFGDAIPMRQLVFFT